MAINIDSFLYLKRAVEVYPRVAQPLKNVPKNLNLNLQQSSRYKPETIHQVTSQSPGELFKREAGLFNSENSKLYQRLDTTIGDFYYGYCQ